MACCHRVELRGQGEVFTSRARSGLVIIALLGFVGSACSSDKVVFPIADMARQLHVDRFKKVAWNDSSVADAVRIVEQLYPLADVDTAYVDSTGRVIAFDYQISSAMLGVAQVHYDLRGVTRLDLYNVFDTRLFKAFAPSYVVYVFHDAHETFVFDGLSEKLYQGYPGYMRPLEPAPKAGP